MIAIGSDHGGFKLKEKLKAYLQGKGFKVNDLGPFSQERCDYPEFAYKVAKEVSDGKAAKGILICKSGIGNSIVANKLPGVRAALSYNLKAARLSREHNDSNVLVLGSLFVNDALAKRMSKVWLETKFAGGRHARRIAQIRELERKIRSGKL